MKIALLCGGPSPERGISLNSARSVLDHLESASIQIIPFYFDFKKRAYSISKSQLYSNTPSDFDFKLRSKALFLDKKNLESALKKCDIAFPVIHGAFGEDGELQSWLEKIGMPFVGSPSRACSLAFDKYDANEFLKTKGFFTLPSIAFGGFENADRKSLRDFFKANNLSRAIVKPANGGSSIGVFSVNNAAAAEEKIKFLLRSGYKRTVVEPFCSGKEFTVIILQNEENRPVAVIPTEIETDYSENQIFDFRKKYLPSRHVRYHCPARFNDNTVKKIQTMAEQMFTALGMRDFARFDGWVLKTGDIWFSDFNPVSGMEQNSFLFQQSSRIGLSHQETLKYVLNKACSRYGIKPPRKTNNRKRRRKEIKVLFGGATSERQVSLMSGTNVWLKLLKSKKYFPKPFLLDLDNNVWELPYSLTLNHTVEEIAENCRNVEKDYSRIQSLGKTVKARLDLKENGAKYFLPEKKSLNDFSKNSKFIFIALHGGDGENGVFQKFLERKKIFFNGPDSVSSSLCINKWRTAQFIKKADLSGVSVAEQELVPLEKIENSNKKQLDVFWQNLIRKLSAKNIIVKPSDDGCSSGIVRLHNANELQKYIQIAKKVLHFVPKNTFKNQNNLIEMPIKKIKNLLFERFVETDSVVVKGNRIIVNKKTNWIEITVGVVGKKGSMKALSPSLTVAEGNVLSLEEKFQGGTGINITPPNTDVISPANLHKAKKSIQKVANVLGLSGYSRIDAFLNVKTGNVMIIEVNTLPALTPSTVLFHQALAEKKPVYPLEFIEKIIELTGY